MTTFSRRISSLAAIAIIAGVLAAGGSAASDPVTAETNSEALACQSGGLHLEGCPIGPIGPRPPTPPTPPKLQVCAASATCLGGPAAKTTPGYDPLYVPEADGGYATAASFTALLATCGPEYTEYTMDLWHWGMASCPPSVASAVNAFGAANGDTAGIIPCNPCSLDPVEGNVLVAWLIGPGWEPYCETDDAGVERCYQPGGGCKTVSCLTY
jgi:hypothetical protein